MLLGVDPGRYKTGWAFSSDRGELLLSGITPTRKMETFCSCLAAGNWAGFEGWVLEGDLVSFAGEKPARVFVGDGTGSAPIKALLEGSGLPAESADESYSTLRGRALYWELHPPRGLRRLIPRSLQVPPRNIDDLAAWALILSMVSL